MARLGRLWKKNSHARLRAIRKSKGFTLIAASIAVFSIVDAILPRPLPFAPRRAHRDSKNVSSNLRAAARRRRGGFDHGRGRRACRSNVALWSE
jgi:hypothetical protein